MNFLKQELIFSMIYVLIFTVLIVFLVEETLGEFWVSVPFLIGALTSLVCNFASVLISLNAN